MEKLFVIIFVIFGAGLVMSQTAPTDSTDNYHIKQWAQGADPGATALNQNSNIIDSAIYNTASRVSTLELTEINGTPLVDGDIDVTLSTLFIPNTYRSGDLVQITGSPGNYSVTVMNQGEFAMTRGRVKHSKAGIGATKGSKFKAKK